MMRAITKAPKPELDRAIVARLQALPEERILDYFWLMHRQGAERLPLLLQVGAVIVKRPASWDPKRVRLEHEQRGGQFNIRLSRERCFACEDGRAQLYAHHILEVHHGGSNAPRNQVPLCFACHQYLHPWLIEEMPSRRQTGFEHVIAIAPRVVQMVAEGHRK